MAWRDYNQTMVGRVALKDRRPWLVAAAVASTVCLGAAVTSMASQRFTQQDADRFHMKMMRIAQFGSEPAPRGRAAAPQTTDVSDAELNAYLRFHAQDQVPVGIVEPTLNALGGGRVSGRAIVDLDAVRKQKDRGWLDPMGYLTGRLPLVVTGTLTTNQGMGRFQLEAAEVSGMTVPKTVLQELLTYYSRTPDDPDGINMDDPFELPARIREIKVGTAQATIVQ
jgi:hypothetical protein